MDQPSQDRQALLLLWHQTLQLTSSPPQTGEDSYGVSVGFTRISSLGSSHNRFTSAEETKEALLLGCPPIGLVDERSSG
jgi:hypothetical protein